MSIWCCGCNAEIEPREATGAEIYPRRPDLKDKRFWRCDTCGNYVGCHGSGRALGTIPTPELRNARAKIHALLDPIWKRRLIARGDLYKRISERIGRQYHTGEIATIEDARAVYRIGLEIARSLR